MITIRIDASGVTSVLQALRFDAEKKSRMLHDIGNELVEQTRLRFITQVSPGNVPWTRSFRASVQGGETLRDTGALMNSFSYRLKGADSVEMGTDIKYASTHQYGAHIRPVHGPFLTFRLPNGRFCKVGSVDIPARPFMGINDDDARHIADICRHYLSIPS